MTPAVVSVDGVSKAYSGRLPWSTKVNVLENVSFTVAEGEVLGLLGPNGAGKTTLIHLLLGLFQPAAGHIAVFGETPGDLIAKGRIGYLPEEFALYRNLTVRGVLEFMAGLFDDAGAAVGRIDEVIGRVDLSDARCRRVRKLSKGETQRLGLAQALLNDPSLLILDEPTSGLDSLGRLFVKQLLREFRSQGRTVILCSHILTDIEEVCDRVVILNHGRLCGVGKPGDLTTALGAANLEEAFVRLCESGNA